MIIAPVNQSAPMLPEQGCLWIFGERRAAAALALEPSAHRLFIAASGDGIVQIAENWALAVIKNGRIILIGGARS